MTSELKCPVCNVPLAEWEDLYACTNDHCPWVGNAELWQALIQSQKDLEIARTALEKLNCEYNHCRDEEFEGADIDWEWWAMAAKNVVDTAIEQIDHKDKV